MFRKFLTFLCLIGLVLCLGLWGVSASGGWSHTHFSIGQDGEETGITFICADGKIGWDEASDMSESLLSPDHGMSLWLPTLFFAASFLFSIFLMRGALRMARRVGTVLVLSLIGLLLSVGLWATSYYYYYGWVGPGPDLYICNGVIHIMDSDHALGIYIQRGYLRPDWKRKLQILFSLNQICFDKPD